MTSNDTFIRNVSADNFDSLFRRSAGPPKERLESEETGAFVETKGGTALQNEDKTYAEMHLAEKANETSIQQVLASGGSYALKYMWRQGQIEELRKEKDATVSDDILQGRAAGIGLSGFYTSLRSHKVSCMSLRT